MDREQRGEEVLRAGRKVGFRSADRLAWAVALAERRLETMTQGDWANAQSELAAFICPEPGSRLEFQWRAPRRETEVAQRVFRRILDGVIRRRDVRLGRHELVLSWFPWPRTPPRGGGRWPQGDGRYTLSQADPTRASVAALHRLAQEMEVAGHLLKACAAPPSRGKVTERCGRWFVQRRPQQAYCSPQCQSRASTRAYRAERSKTPSRRRR